MDQPTIPGVPEPISQWLIWGTCISIILLIARSVAWSQFKRINKRRLPHKQSSLRPRWIETLVLTALAFTTTYPIVQGAYNGKLSTGIAQGVSFFILTLGSGAVAFWVTRGTHDE